jgi:hypothetical protein
MTPKRKLVRRFNARSDSGKQYTVLEYQDFHVLRAGGNTVSEIPGLKLWQTTTGFLLNETDNPKTFQIATTNEIIREV